MKNEVVKINDCELGVKEINGERVITFKDIDAAHKRPEGTARKRFNDNKKRLIEGADYFVLKPIDLRMSEKRTSGIKSVNNAGTTFITESGYLMIVKSLTDDLAWKVQRELVNTYFRAKDIQKTYSSLSELSPELQMATKMLESMIQNELKVKELEKKQEEYENKQVELENSLYEQKKNIDSINGIINVEDNTTQRQLFKSSVSKLAYKWQKPHGIMYGYVYKIINNNLKINLQSRATHRDIKPIDVLEQDGLMEYALRITNQLMQLDRIPDNI